MTEENPSDRLIVSRRGARHRWLRGMEHHELIDSTNARGLAIARDGTLALPYLVVADRQSAGRGRDGSRWHSDDGALTFSLVHPAPTGGGPISILVGVAVCRVIESLRPRVPVGLKWPNDVFIGLRKVCGILIESIPSPSGPLLVIGIGINVRNNFDNAPRDIGKSACALADYVVPSPDTNEILLALLDELSCLLQDGHPGKVWEQFCLLSNHWVRIVTPSGPIEGLCGGIRDDGQLLVVQHGRTLPVLSGEIVAFRSRHGEWER